MNVLVMGIGNLLLQDEGAGVRAVEEFGRRYDVPAGVELLDGGTSGIELLQYLRGRDAVVLVDVVRTGGPCGEISRFEGDDVPAVFQTKISPHQLGVSDLLAALTLTDSMPAKVVLLGIEPRCITTGLDLTPEVSGNLGRCTDMIADELRALGVRVELNTRSAFSLHGGAVRAPDVLMC